MPKPLYALTDGYYEEPIAQPLPVDIPRVIISSNVGTDNIVRPAPDYVNPPKGNAVAKLTGAEGERFQLWPEKIIREGLTAAGKVLSGEVPQWSIDNVTGDVHTSPQMIEKAQEISALAGSGGLAGGVEGAALNATPSLRPALRYKDKLYKGKEGQQHLDVIPENLYSDFQKKAMSGEDIAEYNFGFVNDKGQFLTREKALEYGINTGLIDPQAGKYGALTSTLMADSSKPGTAIEAVAKARPMESIIAKKGNNVQMTGDAEVLKNPTQKDFRNLAKESNEIRTFTDKEGNLYAWDADKGTHEGIANSLKIDVDNWGNHWDKQNGKLLTDVDTGLKGKDYPSWLKDGMLLADSSKEGAALQAVDPVHFKSVDAAKFRLGQLQRDKAASKKAGEDVDSSDYMHYNTQIRALKEFIKNPKPKEIELLAKAGDRNALERMDIDDLDRAAYGYAAGDKATLNPKDIKIIYKDDLLNPQEKFKKDGIKWVKSVDHSEPVKVSVNQKGEITLEDGHHRWFAAEKLGKPLNVEFERIKGKPIEKLLNSDMHKNLSLPEGYKLVPVEGDPFK